MFITAILAPSVEIAALLYILLPLRLGCVPAGFPVVLRTVQEIKRWNMVEVFMLALFVSLVKLSMFAEVIPAWRYGCMRLLQS